jgi:riboflavin kinase/FMN adenylyltransferase
VTVGVFDGIHVAHQQLLRTTVHYAHRLHGTSVVITFDPDPQTILDPAHEHPSLMPLEARLAYFQSHGVDWTWVIPFTKRFARMRAETFIRDLLIERLHTTIVVVGETFAFGHHRLGDMAVLQRLGAQAHMRIVPLPSIAVGGAPISSSRIRRLIGQGRLVQARRLLGRPPELYGVVVQGAGRGRHLGFPTANIRLVSHVLPRPGVYAVFLRTARRRWRGVTPPPIRVRGTRTVASRNIASGELIGGGVMNLGVRPTFGPGPLVCEVHVLGFSGTLLHQPVTISLVARLRNERCFPNLEALRRQILRDISSARRLFSHLP